MAATNTGKFRPDRKDQPPRYESQFKIMDATPDVRIREIIANEGVDVKYGFKADKEATKRTGFLINMHSNEVQDPEDKKLLACVDYYFIEEDGKRFKVSLPFRPYFYILVTKEFVPEVAGYIKHNYSGIVLEVESLFKEDLDMPNHLIGLKQLYIKLEFRNVTEMQRVRRDILAHVRKNKEREQSNTFYTEMLTKSLLNDKGDVGTVERLVESTDHIMDIREYDVPYHVRVSIDLKIFCGSWYDVKTHGAVLKTAPEITKREDLIERPDPIVLAFDIETTKLPLKFPDAATDQVMMISYMIDGKGFLITNREIISDDIDNFEYTPKPEFEGLFKVFNEKDEKALILRFFSHIQKVKPHIFVTYNGDFFDWPFIETRAAVYELDMKAMIGFEKGTDGIYSCRPCIHMDCLCWVKRDSYLPVGSQNLKAVAKAKLRYDPVELDPEDMCKMAEEKPAILANYSVSDAVATYYLYMKYVHPFIFALCTIIPAQPDEVLRKGSGTLCEALLMVEAFHGNIIFPNRQIQELTQFTEEGHVLHTETYVGGHVEALESGVFRADLPCRFRMIPAALDRMIDDVDRTLKHAIEEEEKIPLKYVLNFDDIKAEIVEKLISLRDHPNRMENPIIYHLDVGAMYPNIILTNRLQPSAMVDESVCASCDFNQPDAVCKRNMSWMWRAEFMPASRNEYQRIKQQLETERFPARFPNGKPRAFHQLTKEESAEYEKKRLQEYCRKAYKKIRVTTVKERETTICMKENSFYVDTVRAFRDRRYEYKAMNKKAKQAVNKAIANKNAAEIRSAKNREILYDSLQLAHKCILNSFYGYVMRKGARWHSMEMAGIVCYSGAHIIMKAREIIEQIGRPLELDTDGIWCILPSSFPENFEIHTRHANKQKLQISYPNAVLNLMVKDNFTNDQYHTLTDPKTPEYKVHPENSIFFEVDGPYLAMVLPASKEEGKRLKKRYAVFNFDGSLAELKGFEVKRRGELQLIKIFQSSVFEAFLKGDTLESCYASVAKVANYWLDVLYSSGRNMPDTELFELISENRSMSRKLEDYGTQKTTSISTAKRLAEFLGDEMVKDKGLACRFIISKYPEGTPVTDRAIPLAIFQTEDAVKKHFLRKWLKDAALASFDLRDILDWGYYIERLGGAIQKIITIPAAMQGVSNPVPRIRHPDWLHKRVLEKKDVLRQRKINEIFSVAPPQASSDEEDAIEPSEAPDIEDFGAIASCSTGGRPVVTTTKRKRINDEEEDQDVLKKSWREQMGPPPALGTSEEEIHTWLAYQKKKWALQAQQRGFVHRQSKKTRPSEINTAGGVVRSGNPTTLAGFLTRAQRTLINTPWQIIQLANTNQPGEFKAWVLVEHELHTVKLNIPRIFYANLHLPKAEETGIMYKRVNKVLPRARPVYNLYKYVVPERLYLEHGEKIYVDLSDPMVEGVYETQVPLQFRALLELGCVCSVNRNAKLSKDTDTFSLEQLSFLTIAKQPYLSKPDGCSLRHLYLYHHKALTGPREMYGLFLTPVKRALIIVVDSVRTNLMPNMGSLYAAERLVKLEDADEDDLPPADVTFEIRVETDLKQVYRLIQRALQGYRDEKKGPSMIAIQSEIDQAILQANMPELADWPQVKIHIQDIDALYSSMEWQRTGAKTMIRHYLNVEKILDIMTEQCRYFHIPVGNMPADPAVFGADLFYARHLQRNNFILWCSNLDKPDLGGGEKTDARLVAEFQECSSEICNNPAAYMSVCVELDVDSLAVNTLLQSHHVHDIEGAESGQTFDSAAQVTIEGLMSGNSTSVFPTYDETVTCAEAFRVLKHTVSVWLRDVSNYRNMFSDFQIVHFYRWIRSSKALLYDPALLKTLQILMKKLYMQLVAEFKRLGSIIVYANFNKIIICTKKTKVKDAIGYVEFVVKSIRNKELFHSIQITYNQCWEYLQWLDLANHGGIKGTLPQGLEGVGESQLGDTLTGATQEEADTEEPIVTMNWNLMEYLPEELDCRENFRLAIAGYISTVHLFKKQEAPQVNPVPYINDTLEPASILGVGGRLTVARFAQKLIKDDMAQKLFEITMHIHEKMPEYPVAPLAGGIPGTMVKPALEFAKSICHVLSLDPAVDEVVRGIRRHLLRVVGVGEFSDISMWTSPSLSYILPSVICKVCNHCRDIDLGRDSHHTSDEFGNHWFCPLCKAQYDRLEIESALLDVITKKMIAYNLQDLQCLKCAQIKLENIAKYCSCAGEFKTLISKTDLVKLLYNFQKLANCFGMDTLLETIESIFKYLD